MKAAAGLRSLTKLDLVIPSQPEDAPYLIKYNIVNIEPDYDPEYLPDLDLDDELKNKYTRFSKYSEDVDTEVDGYWIVMNFFFFE